MKQQEDSFYDNQLLLECFQNGKPEEGLKYLNLQSKRLQNGMTAEEIDAVKQRAQEAFDFL
jgi:hypothetical protein